MEAFASVWNVEKILLKQVIVGFPEILVDSAVCVCVCVLEKSMRWFNEKQLLKLLELVDLRALENA